MNTIILPNDQWSGAFVLRFDAMLEKREQEYRFSAAAENKLHTWWVCGLELKRPECVTGETTVEIVRGLTPVVKVWLGELVDRRELSDAERQLGMRTEPIWPTRVWIPPRQSMSLNLIHSRPEFPYAIVVHWKK